MNVFNLIFIFLIFSPKQISPALTQEEAKLHSAINWKEDICSFRGTPTVISDTNITCVCNPEFTNEPNLKNHRYISENFVQCSYEKKRKFIAVFLASFFPIGFDYLYLGHFWIFFLILICCCLNCWANCWWYLKNTEKLKKQSKDSISWLLYVSSGILVVYYIVNLVLLIKGFIKDVNDVDLVEDLSLLLSTQN